MKVTFNTGRLYQREGQIITATREHDKRILFMDHSRGIAGEIDPPQSKPASLQEFIRFVMREYDADRYRMSMDALNLTRSDEILPLRL